VRKRERRPIRLTIKLAAAAFAILALAPLPGLAAPSQPALPATQAAAANPHLAVFRISNDTGNPSYEAACNAATDSLVITLRQLGFYELLPTEARGGTGDLDSLRAWAESRNADYIVFGSIGSASGGRLACGLSLFDRAKGKVSLEKLEDKVAPLDVFDAEDGLVLAMLDAMTGRHLGFGSLVFSNGGVKGSYRVYLDGAEVGSDLPGLDKVLAGSHSLRIAQRRMLGELELVRRDFVVKEGEGLEVAFSVPALTDGERARLEGLEASARGGWADPAAAAEVEGAVSDYLALTRDASYSPAISDYAKRGKQLSAEWSVMRNRLELLDSAWEPESELLDPSVAAYLTAKSCPDPEAVRAKVRENALLLAAFLELRSAKAALDADYAASAAAMASILEFSRYLPEDRAAEYTFAASSLKEMVGAGRADQEKAAAAGKLFGKRLETAKRFYGLKGQAPAGACLAEAGAPWGAASTFAAFGRASAGPAKGKCLLVVESEPESALVSIDDGEPLYAPFSVELEPGAHSFAVAKCFRKGTYYDEYPKQWITLPAGETVRLPLRLKPALASVSLSRVPEGYTVYLDDKELCETPADEVEITAGSRLLRMESPGRKPITYGILVLPGQTEKVAWATTRESACIPVKRTVKLDAKPESWSGIEPIWESNGGSNFMGLEEYGLSRVFICHDDKNLYWRVDFNKLCPLDKLPPGLKNGVTIELAFERSEGNANYNVAFSRKSNRYETWSSLWSRATRKGEDISANGSGIKWKQGPGILVASVPLERVLPYIDPNVAGTVSVANMGDNGWAGNSTSQRFFIDFSGLPKK
jgi:hypothetical protein